MWDDDSVGSTERRVRIRKGEMGFRTKDEFLKVKQNNCLLGEQVDSDDKTV